MIDSSATIDQLIVRAANGDAEAMAAFYDRLHSTVYNWVRQYVRDPHIAEDLAQEVWLKVSQNVGRYRPGTKPLGWLMTITRNTAIDHLRKEQRRPTEVLQADHLQLDRPSPGLSVQAQTERRQLAQAVAVHLNKLREEQRKCLRHRFFDGLSTADTAHLMGKSEVAVRQLTYRSLKKLQKVLPEGDSAAELVDELLNVAAAGKRFVGVRVAVQTTQESAPHVAKR